MAAVLAHSSDHSLSYLSAPHRDTFAAFHSHRGSVGPHRNPFKVFAPHRHSGINSRSTATSWYHSQPQTVERAPAPIDTPSPKYRRSGQSHSRTPSNSSETLSLSWRSHVHSAVVTRVGMLEETRASPLNIYSVVELLRLSASPLVGISKESRDIVDDLVTRHVWRRSTQSGTQKMGRRHNNRGTSKPRLLHISTDSEH